MFSCCVLAFTPAPMEISFSQGPSLGARQSPFPPANMYPTTTDFHQPVQLPAPLQQSLMLDQVQYEYLGSDLNLRKDKQAERWYRTPSKKGRKVLKGDYYVGKLGTSSPCSLQIYYRILHKLFSFSNEERWYLCCPKEKQETSMTGKEGKVQTK